MRKADVNGARVVLWNGACEAEVMRLLTRPLTHAAALAVVASFLPCCGAKGGAETTTGACELLAPDYDDSCTADSDCAAAPPGGDTCDPCSDPQSFWCATDIVSTKTAAAYLAKTEAVQQQMRNANVSGTFCSASCPITTAGSGHLGCVSGTCIYVVGAQ